MFSKKISIIIGVVTLFVLNPVFAQSQWIKLQFPTNENLYMVRFVTPETGWIVGENFVYKTTDAGNTWIQKDNGGASEALYALNKDTVIFSVGNSGGLLRTTDGGQNWITVDTSKLHYTDIKFINSRLGFATGYSSSTNDLGIVKRTTNAGESWSTISSVNLNNYQSDFEGISFTDSVNGWAVTYR